MAKGKRKEELTIEEKLEQALVPREEWPYEVPKNWCWVRLGSIAHVIMGQSPSGKMTTYDSSYTPLIGGAADMGEMYPRINRYTKSVTKLSEIDDLILCIRATLGRPIFADAKYCLGRGVAAIRSDIISKEFLRYYFLCSENYLYENATGTTFLQVTGKVLEHMPFPLIPLAEQQRIVNRIESLFSKLDEAKEKLESIVIESIDKKEAILTAALSGLLTKCSHEVENKGIVFFLKHEKNAIKAGPFGSALKKEIYVENGYKVYGQEQVINGDETIGNYYIDERKYKELESCKVSPNDVLISLDCRESISII